MVFASCDNLHNRLVKLDSHTLFQTSLTPCDIVCQEHSLLWPNSIGLNCHSINSAQSYPHLVITESLHKYCKAVFPPDLKTLAGTHLQKS